MKKLWLFVIILCVGTVLVGGRFRPEPKRRGVVMQIDIYSQHGNEVKQLCVTDMKRMEMVLNYLRTVDAHSPAEQIPAPDPHNSYTILVRHADGRCHIYRQRSDQYFCEDSQCWKTINPAKGRKLPLLEELFAEKILAFPQS